MAQAIIAACVQARSGPLRLDCSKTFNQIQLVSFEIFELKEAPAYNAVSHTWGEAGGGQADIIHAPADALIPVWTNLYIVSQCLRFEVALGEAECIWADALCINREEREEKAVQIPNIGDTYDRASEVALWLGLGSGEEERAILKIEELGRKVIGGGTGEDESMQLGLSREESVMPPPS